MSARKTRGQKNLPVRHSPSKQPDAVGTAPGQQNDLLDWEQIIVEPEVNNSSGTPSACNQQTSAAQPELQVGSARQVNAANNNVRQVNATNNNVHQMDATNDTVHQMDANMNNVAMLTAAMQNIAASITQELEIKLQHMFSAHVTSANMNVIEHENFIINGETLSQRPAVCEMNLATQAANIANVSAASPSSLQTSGNASAANMQQLMQPNANVPTQRHEYVKLVDLPKFSGDPLEWPMFERSFIDTTTELHYTNTQNLIRLRQALVGEARAAVESMLPFPQGVNDIMSSLKESFGRPEQLMNRHMFDMRKLQKIQFGDCYALTKFSNVLRNMTASAKYAGTEYRLCDATLLAECVGKLPYELQLQWAEYKERVQGFANLQHLSSFIQSAAKRANIVNDAQPKKYEANKHSVVTSNRSNVKGHTFTANKRDVCPICKNAAHATADCATLKKMNVDARWERVKSERLCFSCLKYGHGANNCFARQVCGVGGCRRKHHSLLHTAEVQQTTDSEVVFNAEALSSNADILFQIVPVEITAANRTVKTYAFIDQGSSHSMVEYSLARRLGITGQQDVLEMHWLNNVQVKYPTEKVSLLVRGVAAGCKQMKLSNVYTVRDMNLPKQSAKFVGEVGQGAYKKMVKVHYENAVPELIIGLDNVNLTVPLEKPWLLKNGCAVMRMPLGWVVCGPKEHGMKRAFVGCSDIRQLTVLENLMSEFYENEKTEVPVPKFEEATKEDKKLLSRIDETTKFENGKYVVQLLWSNDNVRFPSSFDTAMRRLKGVEHKMKSNSEFGQQYRAIMQDHAEKGYIRKLTADEVANESEKTFYIPHFAVKNPNKEKIRVVFDAAAEINGCSLNKQLLAGPDINASLLEVLFKFRMRPIAVCADIKEMFLRIGVCEEDQNSQRFLWRQEEGSNEVDVYVMTSMLFGAKCSPTLAQFVKNKNASLYKDRHPRAVECIVHHHYVDDLVDSFENEDEAIEVVKQVVKIHRNANFELRSFASNSRSVLQALSGDRNSSNLVNMQGQNVERILGMQWNSEVDTFTFLPKFNKVPKEVLQQTKRPTKREVLSAVMSLFDPFGFLANFVVAGKILMQELWVAKVGWDEQLNDTHYATWLIWLNNLTKVKEFAELRYYEMNLCGEFELHIFADASEKALAAVAYVRQVSESGIAVRFLFAKTKCAPIKYTSIPRLELQAAVLAVRVCNIIMTSHDWKGVRMYFWSDSTTVLSWLNSEPCKFKPFVANRLAEILEYSEPCQWAWLPSEENVADDATRANKNYEPNGRWLKGPKFLRSNDNWPKLKMIREEAAAAEEKRLKQVTICTKSSQDNLIEYNRFSKFERVKRVMAFVLKFCKLLPERHENSIRLPNLQAQDLEFAENTLVRLAQQESYASELACLNRGDYVNKGSSLISLNPKLNIDKLMHVMGRIENASCLDMPERRPVILPPKHPLTALIVKYYHEKFHHINRNTIICEVRRKYWIPGIRALIKTVESKCNFCKIRKVLPAPPMMSALPADRITPYVRPFTFTGIDLFGPLNVAVRRQREKRWVALFTCLTTRAIHLELVADLSSDACLLAIRNFINRRGVPKLMRSDNGTNFVGIAKELKETNDFLDYAAIGARVSNLGIEWRFNCPSNPSEGGVWERLVQSVKKVLYIILKECAPRIETLISLLIEAENIVNSRPLTHLPVTLDDEEPLTPNHFLLNSANSTQTPSAEEHLCLRKQWRIAQNLKNAFWKRWIREYLPELTRRSKWYQPVDQMKIGDLILICEPTQPRSQWKRGRISNLFKGADGIARSAEVITCDTTLRRPLSKLAKLDVASN